MIQFAHKRANNNFNDVVAQLYQQEFKTQEKAKYEHIKQAKEKAIEEQRISEENRKLEEEKTGDEQSERENKERAEQATFGNGENDNGLDNGNIPSDTNEAITATENSTSSVIGNDWSKVSPEIAANYMESKTGVSASKWLDVIYKESSGNPYVENPIGCWGLLQINQNSHGQVSNLSPQDYLDKAVSIYQGSGGTAWATW